MMVSVNIPQLLKQLRLQHNYTMESVAAQIKMSQPTYSRIECGERELTVKEACSLAAFYKIPCSAFFNEEQQAPRKKFR
jgi:transcriptional regulator with XRE-family HTH domain